MRAPDRKLASIDGVEGFYSDHMSERHEYRFLGFYSGEIDSDRIHMAVRLITDKCANGY